MHMSMGGVIKLFFHKFEDLQKSFIASPMPMSIQESLKQKMLKSLSLDVTKQQLISGIGRMPQPITKPLIASSNFLEFSYEIVTSTYYHASLCFMTTVQYNIQYSLPISTPFSLLASNSYYSTFGGHSYAFKTMKV